MIISENIPFVYIKLPLVN